MKKDIIKMAQEAGLNVGPAGMGQTVWGSDTNLERFAAIVAAAEREACAKVADDWSKRPDDVGGYISQNIRARGQA